MYAAAAAMIKGVAVYFSCVILRQEASSDMHI